MMTTAQHNYRTALLELADRLKDLAYGNVAAEQYATQGTMMKARVKNIQRRYRAVVKEQEQQQ